MTTQVLTGLLLLVLPVAYNGFYTLLARSFDYPDILRQPTGEVLERFAAGGGRLVLLWWGFAMSAVLLAPAVVLVSATLADANPTVLTLATAIGLLAAWCSSWALSAGRSRSRIWPALPVTRRPLLPPGMPSRSSSRPSTATWAWPSVSIWGICSPACGRLAGVALLQSEVLHPLFGVIGLLLAPLFVLGSLEFVGPFEVRGWKLAGALVPLAYIGWSVWLLALGVQPADKLADGRLVRHPLGQRQQAEPAQVQRVRHLGPASRTPAGALLDDHEPHEAAHRDGRPAMAASGLRPDLLDRRQQPPVDQQPVQRRQVPGQLMNLDRQQLVQQRLHLPTRQPQHPPSRVNRTAGFSLAPGQTSPLATTISGASN